MTGDVRNRPLPSGWRWTDDEATRGTRRRGGRGHARLRPRDRGGAGRGGGHRLLRGPERPRPAVADRTAGDDRGDGREGDGGGRPRDLGPGRPHGARTGGGALRAGQERTEGPPRRAGQRRLGRGLRPPVGTALLETRPR